MSHEKLDISKLGEVKSQIDLISKKKKKLSADEKETLKMINTHYEQIINASNSSSEIIKSMKEFNNKIDAVPLKAAADFSPFVNRVEKINAMVAELRTPSQTKTIPTTSDSTFSMWAENGAKSKAPEPSDVSKHGLKTKK